MPQVLIPNVNNGAASGAGIVTAIIPDRTASVNFLSLEMGGTSFLKTHIKRITAKTGAKQIWHITSDVVKTAGEKIDQMNAYLGKYTDAAVALVDFMEVGAKSVENQEYGALDLEYIKNVNVEVEVLGATAPTITPRMGLSLTSVGVDAKGRVVAGNPYFNSIYGSVVGMGATGWVPVSLPTFSGAVIKRIWVWSAAANSISGFELRKEGMPYATQTRLATEEEQKRFKRVPQANLFVIDFVVDGDLSKTMKTTIPLGNGKFRNASLELLLNMAATDQLYIAYEVLNRPERLATF